MRKLILVRGPQGSGKSHLIDQMGLTPYALSMDMLRQVVAGPMMTPDGRMAVSAEFNTQVSNMHRALIDDRMRRGELMVVEQAMMFKTDIDFWQENARKYRYETILVDLTNTSLDVMLERNETRTEYTRIPEQAIRDTYDRMIRTPMVDIETLSWTEDLPDRLDAWLACPVMDLSAYSEVVHIGDLQGCFTVLAGPNGPLREGLDPKKFYIFTGDLLDRGIENGLVMRWALDHIVGKSNAILLYGNHEVHPDLWSSGQTAVSNEFLYRTLPQLKRAGIEHEDARRLISSTKDALFYTYGAHKVMVTHAGLPTVPLRPERIASFQYYKGTGNWVDPVDSRFEQNAPEGWVQVHGHRNNGPLPIQAAPRSFNLEDSVEFGGSLRTATLSSSGWSTKAYPNTVFLPWRDRRDQRSPQGLVPDWMTLPDATTLPADLLATMRAHPGVNEKISESHPHISSLNFTRTVFQDKSWDEVVTKARGLFFNRETGEIVARAYDKFFNGGERPETELDYLLENAAFPIRAFRKENGYLGLIGYDRMDDTLFFSSKSTPDSPFTTWLEDIYLASTTQEQREKLHRYVRDMDASIAVEAIDPARDPHMIEYAEPCLVLLDVFHRSSTLERLSFEKLTAFGKEMGLTAKSCDIFLSQASHLNGWYNRTKSDLTYQIEFKHVEGLVLEDANGVMTKTKLPYYEFWKTTRSATGRMARLRRSADEQAAKGRMGINAQALESLVARYDHPLAESYLRWALKQPALMLDRDIITLRKEFQTDPSYRAEMEQVPWIPIHQRIDQENAAAAEKSSEETDTKKKQGRPRIP